MLKMYTFLCSLEQYEMQLADDEAALAEAQVQLREAEEVPFYV